MDVFLCHCRQCQKAQGSAFVASVPVPVEDFELLSGADALKAFRATPAKGRYFCGECGSPIYSQVDGRDVLRLRAGSLDPPADLAVRAHIHTEGRAAWYPIADATPRYPGQEPDRP
ncbi:MAG: GFA family protein [Gammaproteobacteria bacterium]